ncbi:hypothetical protein IWZ03DRAFT_406980 [Phyllosticta citriasiana]|uniref:Kinetochore protein SPC25 n=1 Tax=Phyllosticta citriasiana TaxID=595635 RepID=A0ABR1KI36_9PEZI
MAWFTGAMTSKPLDRSLIRPHSPTLSSDAPSSTAPCQIPPTLVQPTVTKSYSEASSSAPVVLTPRSSSGSSSRSKSCHEPVPPECAADAFEADVALCIEQFPDVMTATMSDVTQHMERLRWNLPPAKGNLEVELAACVERFCDDVGETMGMSMRRLKGLPGADGCEVKVEERTGGMVMAKELDGVKAEHAKEIDGLNKKIERHEDMMKEIDNTKTEHDKKIESLNREIERHERLVAEVRASNKDLQSQIRRIHNKFQEWYDTGFNPRTIGWFFPNLSEGGGARALNLQVDDVLYEDIESFIEAVEAAWRTVPEDVMRRNLPPSASQAALTRGTHLSSAKPSVTKS